MAKHPVIASATMPICNKCQKFSNCLTVDFCEHCGAKDWKVESLHDRPMREHYFLRPIVSFVGVVLWAVVVIGAVLGGLWWLIAIIKWMWNHS